MNSRIRFLAIALIGFAAALPAAAADETASPSALEQQLAGMRRPYDAYRWRIPMISSVESFMLGFQYRAWAHSGLGLSLEGSLRGTPSRANLRSDAEWAGYTSGGLALQYWIEQEMRLVPMVTGLRFGVGVLGTAYSLLFAGGSSTDVASSGGLLFTVAGYATLPLASYLVNRPAGRWWPHLQVEISCLFEGFGDMRNTRDYDLDGDGIVDHVNGEEFRDPSGKNPKGAFISSLRFGLVWIL